MAGTRARGRLGHSATHLDCPEHSSTRPKLTTALVALVVAGPRVVVAELVVAESVVFQRMGCGGSVALQPPAASATAVATAPPPPSDSETVAPGAAPAPHTAAGSSCWRTAPPVRTVAKAKRSGAGVGAGAGVGLAGGAGGSGGTPPGYPEVQLSSYAEGMASLSTHGVAGLQYLQLAPNCQPWQPASATQAAQHSASLAEATFASAVPYRHFFASLVLHVPDFALPPKQPRARSPTRSDMTKCCFRAMFRGLNL